MKKGKRIFLGISGGILAVAVVVLIIWFIEYIKLPEMDMSESPLGMEWGMSQEEVEAILAEYPEYTFIKQDGMLMYKVLDYQGMDGLSGYMLLGFYEDELTRIYYVFESVEEDGMSLASSINQAYKSSKKELKQEYEAPHILTKIILALFGGLDYADVSDDWIGEKTLVSVMYEKSKNLMILYEPIDGNEEYVEMLQDPITYMKETDEVIHNEESNPDMMPQEEGESSIENTTLFEAYPDEIGWMEARAYGDIPKLADAAYIDASLSTGTFLVSTPEELASFCYIVNTSQSGQGLFMQLQNDIDLSGYQWAPMGWSCGISNLPFTCVVDGNGYTIYNMTIDCDDSSVGFIGWETGCSVSNITFENASVSGNSNVGIITGEAIGGWYENCHVTGEVNGYQAGSLLGYFANGNVFDCTADVTVNGEVFEYLTWNDKEKSEIVIEYAVTIVLHDDYTVTRPPIEDYDNLGWLIKKDGVQVLHRNAENELYYCYFDTSPGTYTICLTAFVDGQYVPVSNTVEYTIK